jgi:1-acyl-sn-glycerol-3-phosphate acyltransferase
MPSATDWSWYMGDPEFPDKSRPPERPRSAGAGQSAGGSRYKDGGAPRSGAVPQGAGGARHEETAQGPGPRLRIFSGRRSQSRDRSASSDATISSPDDFFVRLQTLEAQVEDALARSRIRAGGLGQDLLIEAINASVALYVEAARQLGGVGDLVARLRMLGRGTTVDAYGFDPAVAEWVEPVLEALFHRWWRVDVVNIERVPARGPVMFVANHGGTLLPYDALMLATAVRSALAPGRRARPLVEDFLYYWPHVGTLLSRIGAVRADRANARRLLDNGEAVIVFPEGTRGLSKRYRDRYRLERFGRGGFVSACLETRAALVPVAVIGAEETHPLLARATAVGRLLGLPYLPITPTFPWLGLLGLVPLPTKWTIRFGEPINLADRYETADPGDPALLGRLREEVRQRIQRMVLEGLRRRRSIFFG